MNEMSLERAAEIVSSNWRSLPEKDQGFAQSLCGHYQKWGERLSSGRVQWLKILAKRLEDGPRELETHEIGTFAPLAELLGRPRKLKYPAIVITLPETGQVKFYISKGGKYPGAVNIIHITAADGSPVYGQFGRGKWLGRVTKDGVLTAGPSGVPEDVIEAARKVCQDPAAALGEYGRESGRCCMCNHSLSDDADGKSIEMGYGPVCAKNYGLPWGKRKK